MKIILNPTAPAAREIDTFDCGTVPDLWHIGMFLQEYDLPKMKRSEAVLNCWHLAHDLINFLNALDAAGGLELTIERAIGRIDEYLQDSTQNGLEDESGREQCEAWAAELQGYAGMMQHFKPGRWRECYERECVALIKIAREEAEKYPEPEVIYTNYYRCDCGREWSDQWSAQCNDKCEQCGKECEPYESKEI